MSRRHLQVLHLVLADRHQVRAVDEDVGGHQHRVGEQPDARRDALCDLVLVRVGAFEQAHAGDGGENPRQFAHFRHVGLAEEAAPSPGRGRARGSRGPRRGRCRRGCAARVARPAPCSWRPRRASFSSASLQRCQGVVVGDEVEALAAILQLDVLLDRAEVVAEVQLAGRLHAAEDAVVGSRNVWTSFARGLFFGIRTRLHYGRFSL